MMQLKQKLINRFEDLHCKVNDKKYFVELDKHLGVFFPSKNFVAQNLRTLTHQDGKFNFFYNVICLPFHTRDIGWLTNFVMDRIHNMKNLSNIPYNTLRRYIENSPKFIARRNQYEKDLVQGYIYNWLEAECDDFYLKADQKQAYQKKRNFDEIFREKVLNAITALGFERNVVDLYMEECAPVWRKRVMQQTFINRLQVSPFFKDVAINQDQRIMLCNHNPDIWNQFVNKEFDFMNIWVSAREVKYYEQHKNVVDKAGTKTTAMELAPHQVYRLRDEKSLMRSEYRKSLEQSARIVQELDARNSTINDKEC